MQNTLKTGNVSKMNFDFGVLREFTSDSNITDINFNGTDLWVDHLEYGRRYHQEYMSHQEIMKLCEKLANAVNRPLNVQTPILEADLDSLRISIVHPSVSKKVSLSIRKSHHKLRFNEEEILEGNYISKSALNFLKYSMSARANMMISGLPGAGKTELLKFLTQFIEDKQRVITIEDSYEIHYRSLHPHRDAISMKTNRYFNYRQAIKASLRQRADWILLSEVRGDEVVDLVNTVSTGTHLISTIHAQSARQIPERMAALLPSQYEGLRKNLEDLIDVGVHIDVFVNETGILRRIREIVVFDQGEVIEVYHYKSKKDARRIPTLIKEKSSLYGDGL